MGFRRFRRRFNGAAPARAPWSDDSSLTNARCQHQGDIRRLQRGRARAGAECLDDTDSSCPISSSAADFQRGRARAGAGSGGGAGDTLAVNIFATMTSTGPRPRGARNGCWPSENTAMSAPPDRASSTGPAPARAAE